MRWQSWDRVSVAEASLHHTLQGCSVCTHAPLHRQYGVSKPFQAPAALSVGRVSPIYTLQDLWLSPDAQPGRSLGWPPTTSDDQSDRTRRPAAHVESFPPGLGQAVPFTRFWTLTFAWCQLVVLCQHVRGQASCAKPYIRHCHAREARRAPSYPLRSVCRPSWPVAINCAGC